LTLILIAGAGAVTGLVLKDQIEGRTTIAVSQAIRVDPTQFSSGDVSGDADEALVTVSDDGMEWAVHVEANNGDLITIELPIANEANQNIIAELHLSGGSPYTIGADPIYYWSDTNHDGRYTGGTFGEAVIDPRGGNAPLILERDDTVAAVGTTDYASFTTDHWFFDASDVAAGTYGPGGVLGPSYNDDVFSDYDGSTPEAILLDGGNLGILDPGVLDGVGSTDTVITAGKAALERDLGPYSFTGTPAVTDGVDRLSFDATLGTSWLPGYDIFINGDGDTYYTSQADSLVHSGAAALPIVAGTQFEPFDATDDVYWYDQGVSHVFDGTDSLWIDPNDDGVYSVHGTSIGTAGAVTDLTMAAYPPYGIFSGTVDIAFDGDPSQTYLLDNAGEILEETVSRVGVEAFTGPIGAGYWVELDNTGDYFLVTGVIPWGPASTIDLIGDVAVGGDTLAAADDLVVQWIDSTSGTDFLLPLGTHWDSNFDGVLDLDVWVAPFTKAEVSAGDILMTSGPTQRFIAGESLTVDNTFATDWTGSLKVLVLPGTGFSVGTIIPPVEIKKVNPIDMPIVSDLDDFYLDSGADIAAALDDTVGALGTATYDHANFPGAYKINSADTTAASAVVVTPGSLGTDLTPHLKLGLAQGGSEYLGGDTEITGGPIEHVTNTNIEVITANGRSLVYLDGELAATDGLYQLGEDIYWEQNPGAATYSPPTMTLPETVVYTGANGQQLSGGFPPVAGTLATYLEAADNIWYRDWDHDTWYDAGEPLVVSADGDLDAGDEVLARADGPGTWGISHGTDMWKLEDDFNGANGHDYYYIDDSNDGLYTDGEAILDQIYGASNDLIRLEEDDFVIHHGLANLGRLPLVQSGGGSWTYKFLVPSVCNLGSPLRIKIHIAIEDAAPTGFYKVSGRIIPLNY